ncbi:dipeptidase 1-like isoform X2 [Dysidea avara]|uniref:dipeptidase 1-like isoform X2 n=1 Tax=Dysidea avara TaxID=196820 RepID=UPI003321E93C
MFTGLIIVLLVTVVSSSNNKIPREDTVSPRMVDPYQHAVELLSKHPLIDGHDDLAEWLRGAVKNHLSQVDLSGHVNGSQADIPRLLKGKLGAQFWSAYMSCKSQYLDATRTFIDQIDVIKRFVAQYPIFKYATSADELHNAFVTGHIASLIGVEGGHAIDSSLATLRQLYDLGVRYMTLTHTCDTPWADTCSIPGPPRHGGLNDFGTRVVKEMNRLGMMVDISHVSATTMRVVLNTTLAPVIFSHSSAYALCDNPRNVPDDVLQQMPANGGVVMVNFYPNFINCSPNASLSQVADHIDHIKKMAGVDHVGIGSDFNGIEAYVDQLLLLL